MKNLSVIGLLFLVFFSCNQDIDEEVQIEMPNVPIVNLDDYNPTPEFVNGTIYGRVYDENENAVSDAVVTYNEKTFSTDAEGRFLIENEMLDRQGTFFTIEADGYFKGSRRIYPTDGSVNYTYVQLLSLDEIGSFDAASGGEIVGDDGLRITFSENSIRSSIGGLYNGEVTVAAKWLDPTASNIAEIMPGDLLGFSSGGNEVSLATYGMMAIELFDENDNNINIAEGNTALLSFPVPQDLINEAPTEIPLWSFEDDQFGIWVEEGTATLQGDSYVGQVSHFSFWNCDVPFPLVFVEGQIVTEDGNPLPNSIICIDTDEGRNSQCGRTDNEGYFAGKMPQNKELTLKIIDHNQDCEFSSVNLGSFGSDTNLGQVQVIESGAAFTIKGSIVDCENIPITNGLLKFEIGNTQSEYYIGGDGSFEAIVLNCDNDTEISVTAVNIDGSEEGTPLSMQISPEVNFGTITACGNPLTEFFTLNLNGFTATITEDLEMYNETGSENSNAFMAAGLRDSLNLFTPFSFKVEMDSGSMDTYTSEDVFRFQIDIRDLAFNENASSFCASSCAIFDMNITENGSLGGHWAGEFSGTQTFRNLDDNSISNAYSFTGKFRVPVFR